MGVIPGDSRPVPDGALSLSGLNALRSYTEDYVKARARGEVANVVAPAKNQFFQNIMGGFDTVPDAVDVVEGAVNERLDLLDGVRGYGSVYQPYNYGGNVNSVSLSFTDPVGPMKGVSIEPAVKGLRIEEPGLWLVSVRATGRATVATNGVGQQDRTELTVREYPIGDQPRDIATMTGNGGNGRVTNAMTFPLIVEQAGTVITVDAYSSRWRRWEGGKLYSNLSVTKLDSRPENPGDWTVPDA